MLKFRFLTGMILFWYHVIVSMHGAGNGLELKEMKHKGTLSISCLAKRSKYNIMINY